MRRTHLFEFEDILWLPRLFRGYITSLLSYQILKFKIYNPAISKITHLIDQRKDKQIVDLCSGNGGPILDLEKALNQRSDKKVRITLTDKFPNKKAFENLKKTKTIHVMHESIDATNVPKHLKGLRTIFTAFHHFKPQKAKKILQDAINKGDEIAIFEITERNLGAFLTLFIAPIACWYFTLFIRPLNFSRLFWTYLIPIVPVMYTWDGLISNLRSYKIEELKEMTHSVDEDSEYCWEIGKVKSKFHIYVTYLIGFAKKKNPITR